MATYILQRVILLIPVMLVVGIVVFMLVHLVPGNPAAVLVGENATAEQIDAAKEKMGLNDPLPVQFFRWFGDAIRLDFGDSYFSNQSVTTTLSQRKEPTIFLTTYALIIEVMIGVPAGVIAAVKRNSIIDRALMIISISGAAIPTFFMGILLILIFAVRLKWVPSGGFVSISEDPARHFKMMILPAFTLGFASAGLLARLVRSSMLDVLNEDYVRTAMAKGLRFRTVVSKHALRNALIPAITVIGFSIGGLLGGAVVTETVFTIPGMGRLVVGSIARRDYPVIQGAIMLIASIYVLVNLFVDILYAYIDPRIRYGGG
ncbi:MAG: ABC transporter permease [Thermomicrobiales bacterium]|nr:ABC transporter permease [Thermomicrobiales bacterium]